MSDIGSDEDQLHSNVRTSKTFTVQEQKHLREEQPEESLQASRALQDCLKSSQKVSRNMPEFRESETKNLSLMK